MILQVAGQPVLLDRQSGLGFKESRHDGYPVLLGMIRNGEVIPRSADLELFSMLEVFLNERKVTYAGTRLYPYSATKPIHTDDGKSLPFLRFG